ncbi:MAG TPA: hypothetical protein VK464_14290 [Symbiobacteriaceae bacterium]|nr:hypothetical protein [Symbiobacteriaceae bacterium]
MTPNTKVLRSTEGLVEFHAWKANDGNPNQLLAAIREHWATLRAKNLAAAYPIQVLSSATGGPGSVAYVFKWKSKECKATAQSDSQIQEIEARITAMSTPIGEFPALNEVYQGFDYQKFPDIGGVELLKGKCNCVVHLDGKDYGVELNVANGFVLMHRAPGGDVDADGTREMFVQILDHGGDCATPNVETLGLSMNGLDPQGAGIRVGQNKEMPQYGLIRAQSKDRDFPATAMWVVAWRIWTPLGTLITDPTVPLVFGPTTVYHYPPVGTEFHSSTGPVDLIHELTGQVVGKLTPRELTAFDIVVTKDDEIPSTTLNKVPPELVELFNAKIKDL